MANGSKPRPIPMYVLELAGKLSPAFMKEVYPAIVRVTKWKFQKMPPKFREEATQEAICFCWQEFLRALRLDQDPLNNIGALCYRAVRSVISNRPFTGRLTVDVMSRECQEKYGFSCATQASDRMNKTLAFTL